MIVVKVPCDDNRDVDYNKNLNDKRPPGEQKMQLHPSGFLQGHGPF